MRKRPTDGGVGQVRVEVFDARPIVRSSLRFEYERLDHPRLKELREKYRLDEVVAGAKSQWEYAIRLNHWVSCQWKWHPPVDYPRWDALVILEKQAARGGREPGRVLRALCDRAGAVFAGDGDAGRGLYLAICRG